MYLPSINEPPIILSPSKSVALNFTMYVLMILTWSLRKIDFLKVLNPFFKERFLHSKNDSFPLYL